jgi:hypothetical protein
MDLIALPQKGHLSLRRQVPEEAVHLIRRHWILTFWLTDLCILRTVSLYLPNNSS